jgi:hypothetical protein
MTAAYWEDRGDIIEGPATAERAAKCFAEAAADPHSRLTGDMQEFQYYGCYIAGVGNAIRVHFRRLADTAGEAGEPGWQRGAGA